MNKSGSPKDNSKYRRYDLQKMLREIDQDEKSLFNEKKDLDQQGIKELLERRKKQANP